MREKKKVNITIEYEVDGCSWVGWLIDEYFALLIEIF